MFIIEKCSCWRSAYIRELDVRIRQVGAHIREVGAHIREVGDYIRGVYFKEVGVY